MKKDLLLKVLLIFILILHVTNACTQNLSDENKYRVRAIKKGQPEVYSVSNEVTLASPVVLYLPLAFTPNGDGINDTFGAIGEGITEYSLQIFNRWGNLIFESNDPGIQWDGTYMNTLAAGGTYVYQVKAKGINSRKNKIHKTGSVTLITS